MRLTGLKVSRPKLPLLFRLPISVWELDWDIPSKNGLCEEREGKPKNFNHVNVLLMLCDSKTFQNISSHLINIQLKIIF